MVTGWTWEYVDEHMTLPRLAAMERYMTIHPPVNVLLARFLGYTPPPEMPGIDADTGEWSDDMVQSFMQEFAMVGGSIG